MRDVEKQLLVEQTRLNGRCCVRVGGFCMSPVIRNGAMVTIAAKSRDEFAVGEILAYFIGERLYVHRLASRENGRLRMAADNDTVVIHEISPEEAIGRVVDVRNPSIFQRFMAKSKNIINRFSRSL